MTTGDPVAGRMQAIANHPGCTVVVCHGDACANRAPSAATIVDRLRPAIRDSSGALLVASHGCLGPCRHAPFVLIQRRAVAHHPERRPPTGRDITVSATARDLATIDELGRWVRAGGPGVAPLPAPLDPAIIAIR